MRLRIALLLLPLAAGAAEHRPLLPQPREVRYGAGSLSLSGVSVRVVPPANAEDQFAASVLTAALSLDRGTGSGPEIILRRTPQQIGNSPEGYSIKVTAGGAEITAGSAAGLFYGVQTMRQLATGDALSEVEIRDWPALPHRGFMMDISHGPMPTEAEIKRQIDFLSRWKANQYYFYSEASIEIDGYPLVNPDARYTKEELRRIIAYAKERHVEVVPCLEFYGHLHDLFRVERYAQMAPVPYGGEFNPHHAEVRKVLEDWIGQLAALFPSEWFHVGLDEPWALEQLGSKAAGVPPGQLYIEQLKTVSDIVRKNGKRMMFWADMVAGARIFTKYPELISQLPPGTIAVPWHYSPEKDYTPMVAPLRRAGIDVVVAPAVWNWNEIAPSFRNSFANIGGFLEAGKKEKAIGLLNTGWSDSGQVLYRMSLPGMAFGAAAPWQAAPMNSPSFFSEYAALMYSERAAAKVAAGLELLTESQEAFGKALGGGTIHSLWADPLAPRRLERVQAHSRELHQARLNAEEAQSHFRRALELKEDPSTIGPLLLGARMLDYLGMKYLYAAEMAGYFERLGPKPDREAVYLLIRIQSASQNHGLIQDLLDGISELKQPYREAWLAEYRPYRLQSALGRWQAEYEYWRALQARFQEFGSRFKTGDSLPPIEDFRPKR